MASSIQPLKAFKILTSIFVVFLLMYGLKYTWIENRIRLALEDDSLYILFSRREPRVCNIPMIAITTMSTRNLKSIENFSFDINTRQIPLIIIVQDSSLPKLESILKVKTVHVHCWLEMNFDEVKVPGAYIMSSTSLYNCNNRGPVGIDTVQNAAYGFAFLMGACSIWEFEETSILPGPEHKVFFSNTTVPMGKMSEFTVFSHETLVTNTYALFNPKHNAYQAGISHDLKMQPRGIPYADVQKSVMPTLYGTYMLNSAAAINSTFKTGIIQSLQDDYPDLNPDNANKYLTKLTFRPTIPHVNIHPSQFTPVNDKATLFYGNSMWALFRPPSIPSRMSDIWRGYIAQTIMRCTGQLVMVKKPHVLAQMVGSKSKQLSAEDQKKLQVLIETLTTFQCISSTNGNITVGSCYKQLYRNLFGQGLITAKDLKQVYEWFNLLAKINYKFPIIDSSLCNVRSKSSGSMFLLPPPHHPEKALKDLKFRNKKLPEYSQMLLVVQVNHRKIDIIPVWLAIFQYLVPASVRFYVPALKECFSFATPFLECNFTTIDYGGHFQYESVAHAMQKYPNFEMYFHVHDDLMFNPLGFESILKTKDSAVAHPWGRNWFCAGPGGKDILPKDPRGMDPVLGVPVRQMNAKGALIPLISNFSKYCPATKRSMFNYTSPSKYGPQETCLFGIAPEYDSFAVPKRFKEEWIEISKIGRKHKIYCEIIIPFIQFCVMGSGTKPTTTIEVTRTRYITTKEQVEKTKYCKDINKAATDLHTLGTKRIFPQGADLRSGHPFKVSVHTIKALAGRNCFLEPFY